MTSPDAVSVTPGCVLMPITAVVRSITASAICEAMARLRMRSYSRCSEASEPAFTALKSVGRMASWASWAEADLVLNMRVWWYSAP